MLKRLVHSWNQEFSIYYMINKFTKLQNLMMFIGITVMNFKIYLIIELIQIAQLRKYQWRKLEFVFLDVMSFQKNISRVELIKIISSIFGYKNLTESTSKYIEAVKLTVNKHSNILNEDNVNIIYLHNEI